LAEDHSWIVLELGASEPGHILKLAEIAHPKIGVITSIGPAHLASFGSVAMIAQSKWELMESLPSDGMAVVPWGEPTLEPLIRSFTKRLVFFGEDSSCAVRASAIESKDDTRFILHIGSMSAKVQLPVPGRFNVKNALASAAVGWLLGISVDRIAEGLRSFVPPPMRMQTIKHSSGAIFVNDAYNANPASMVQSIWSFMENYSDKERVVVLGSMAELGEESPKLHFHIGTEVGKCTINKIFLFGEETKMVLDGLMAVGRNQRDIVHTNKIEELIEQVRKQLKPNVAILFKGSRVMQLERVIEALQKNAEVNV
jgi:UDP-N-acetylmuramoyl-tripeptide--D-alanyl-D-alanine ligase